MACALSEEKIRSLPLGAYDMAAHGHLRAGMEMDTWIMPRQQNSEAVLRALRRFGAAMQEITKTDLEQEGTIF